MKKTFSALAALVAASALAGGASAATTLTFGFEEPDVPTGSWGVFAAVNNGQWKVLTGPGIEVQDNAAGAPSVDLFGDDPRFDGGNQFVELDSHGGADTNSSMYYQFDSAGAWDVSFLYSPRPGVSSLSNPIDVFLNGTQLFGITQPGGGGTNWSLQSFATITVKAGDRLIFAANGTDDQLGGYVDNITLKAVVPEPTTWAMMIAGFGLLGGALRRRSALATA